MPEQGVGEDGALGVTNQTILNTLSGCRLSGDEEEGLSGIGTFSVSFRL